MRASSSATPPPTGVELMFCRRCLPTWSATTRSSCITWGPTTSSYCSSSDAAMSGNSVLVQEADDGALQFLQSKGIGIDCVDLSCHALFSPCAEPLRKVVGCALHSQPRFDKVEVERHVRDGGKLHRQVRGVLGNDSGRHNETLRF